MRTTFKHRLLAGAALAGALFITLIAPTAAQGACSLTVQPKDGAPGTSFVFTGTGFTGTTVSLTKAGTDPIIVTVTDKADPFHVSLLASVGDVGHWRAVAAGCADPATFQVSMPPTTTAAGASVTTTPERAGSHPAAGRLHRPRCAVPGLHGAHAASHHARLPRTLTRGARRSAAHASLRACSRNHLSSEATRGLIGAPPRRRIGWMPARQRVRDGSPWRIAGPSTPTGPSFRWSSSSARATPPRA